jgi:hypothetical protein
VVAKIARRLRVKRIIRWNTTLPKDDKFKEYTRYAAVCLNLMAGTKDPDARKSQCDTALP